MCTAKTCVILIILAVAVGYVHADTYHWIGAGTGGNTATDSADLTTNWDRVGNWLEGAVPTENVKVYITLTNLGYCNRRTTQETFFNIIYVDGITPYGALHIGNNDMLNVYMDEFIGSIATGRILQDGGTQYIGKNNSGIPGSLYLGQDPGSYGEYELIDGRLEVNSSLNTSSQLYVGYQYGAGYFRQTGGNVNLGRNSGTTTLNLGHYSGSYGEYELSGGLLELKPYHLNPSSMQVFVGKYQGQGLFTQTGGSFRVSTYDTEVGEATIYVGHQFGRGDFLHSGGYLSTNRMEVGSYYQGSGSYQISGSAVADVTELVVGVDYLN